MENNNSTERKPNRSEAACMHPRENIIALKGKNQNGVGHFVQIFNKGTRQKLKNCEFTENVVFWKWANNNKLAVVTPTKVYHLDITKENEQAV